MRGEETVSKVRHFTFLGSNKSRLRPKKRGRPNVPPDMHVCMSPKLANILLWHEKGNFSMKNIAGLDVL